jgi:hypothetical protein
MVNVGEDEIRKKRSPEWFSRCREGGKRHRWGKEG